MKLNTKYHGVRDYENKDVIYFKNGLPGFEELKNYIIFPIEENEVFNILHSVDVDSVGLVVVSPFYVDSKYEFKLTDAVLESLKIKDENEVLVLNTVTLHSKVENITANLRAPIIINITNKTGEQIILDDEKYQVKHPIVRE